MAAKPNLLLLAVLVACYGALAGCAADLKVPEKVQTDVPVACVAEKDLPAAPRIRSAAELLLLDRYQRTLALWADHEKLRIYAEQLEAIAAACSKIPANSLERGALSPGNYLGCLLRDARASSPCRAASMPG